MFLLRFKTCFYAIFKFQNLCFQQRWQLLWTLCGLPMRDRPGVSVHCSCWDWSCRSLCVWRWGSSSSSRMRMLGSMRWTARCRWKTAHTGDLTRWLNHTRWWWQSRDIKKFCRCRGTARRVLSLVTTKVTFKLTQRHWYSCRSRVQSLRPSVTAALTT